MSNSSVVFLAFKLIAFYHIFQTCPSEPEQKLFFHIFINFLKALINRGSLVNCRNDKVSEYWDFLQYYKIFPAYYNKFTFLDYYIPFFIKNNFFIFKNFISEFRLHSFPKRLVVSYLFYIKNIMKIFFTNVL